MNKANVKLLVSTCLCFVFLSACSVIGMRISMLEQDTARETTDACFEHVLKSIQAKDADALSGIFSEQALNKADKMDEGIEYLFCLIQGEVESWQGEPWLLDTSKSDGNVVETAKGWYEIVTTEETYSVFLLLCIQDTEYPENVGLYALRAVKTQDKEAQFDSWQKMNVAGIWLPKE